jgi:hypothetical protein
MAKKAGSSRAVRAPLAVRYDGHHVFASVCLTPKQIVMVVALMSSPVAIELIKVLLNVR